MGDFASKGVAGAGLGTGIAGLALGVLNGGANMFRGGFGGWGNGYWGNGGCGCGWGNGYGWNGGYNNQNFDMSVSEALAERDAEIARLHARSYSDESDLKLYQYFDGKIEALEKRFCQQEVYNATMNGAIGNISNQVKELQTLVGSITRTAVPTSAICNFGGCNCGTSTT